VGTVATEKLNINGWNNGWPFGFVSNVDDAIANPDGQTVSTSTDDDVVIFDLDASAIDDNDVVTDVGITVRGSFFDDGGFLTAGQLDVSLLIGGVSQGTESTGILQPVQANYVLSNAGWDSDWTAAQLAGMQVRVIARTTDSLTLPEWALDCLDVDITYTENTSSTREPAVATLTLTGDAPVTEIPGQRHVVAGSAALASQAPTLALNVVTPKGSVVAAGQLSYANPVTEQLQINSWDNGWPSGFVANVDDTVANADGQTVSTPLYGDVVFFGLDDVPATLVDEDTVLGVSMLVRAKFDYLGSATALEANLVVSLVIDGTPLAIQNINLVNNEGSFINTALAHPSWNQDWTVAQLNSMQIKVQAFAIDTDEIIPLFEMSIDTIDVYVEHSAQSPIIVIPPVVDLDFSSDAPTIRRLKYEQPLVGTLALAGKAPTLQSIDQTLPSEARRFLVGKRRRRSLVTSPSQL